VMVRHRMAEAEAEAEDADDEQHTKEEVDRTRLLRFREEDRGDTRSWEVPSHNRRVPRATEPAQRAAHEDNDDDCDCDSHRVAEVDASVHEVADVDEY
jgi:hypothetical protein